MARFLALGFFTKLERIQGAAGFFLLLGLTAFLEANLQAQTMMQETTTTPGTTTNTGAPKPPANPAAAKTTPAPTTAAKNDKTPPAPLPPPPAPVPDTFNRYGKIWAPSDDIAHPIKLNVQFPGVGEMKVPSQEELSVRDKLEQLATLSDDDIRAQLALWPPYAKMKLADEGQLLMRIQQFKEQRTKIAMDKAHELGLLNSLTPDQKARFEKEYWDKRLQMDHELAKQFEPILKAREQKLREDLFREFSTPGTAVPPPSGQKPPAVPLAQAKPGDKPAAPTPPPPSPDKTATIPIAQGKPAPGTTPSAVQKLP